MEEAARQAGIPIEEVFSYISKKMAEIDTLNFELRLVGQAAVKKALTKLSKLARGEQRMSGQSMGNQSESWAGDDLEAAKALAKLGVDALKLSRAGSTVQKEPTDPDLFDAAPDPWKLKKVE